MGRKHRTDAAYAHCTTRGHDSSQFEADLSIVKMTAAAERSLKGGDRTVEAGHA